MKKIAPVLISFFICGCASTNKGRAAQLVVVSDGVADEIANGWKPFRHSQVDHCRAILPDDSSENDRIECLGVAAKEDELEAIIQSLIAIQVSIKEAVKCEDLKTCPSKIDWKELLLEIEKTWNDLRPFLQAVREAR